MMYLITIGYIIVNITCNIRLCKVYIPMYWKYITCYVANLENRCMLLEPELLVCRSCSKTWTPRPYKLQNPKAARQGLQANQQIQHWVIKQSNNSRGTLLLARLLWSILVSSSYLVTLITQEYMTLQSVFIHTIDASVAPAPITEYP